MKLLIGICLAATTFISLTKSVEANYSVQLRSSKSRCFTIKTPRDQMTKISGHFEMIDEILPATPLSFEVTSIGAKEKTEYKSSGDASGNFHFSVTSSTYKFCIGNGVGSQYSDNETRTVGFFIRVKSAYLEHEETPGPLTEEMTFMEDLTDDLLFNLEELLDYIEVKTDREREHRHVSEKTFRNVWLWTIIEKVVLILVSLGQIMYIKYYMSRKSGF